MSKRSTWPNVHPVLDGDEANEARAHRRKPRTAKNKWYNQPAFLKERDKWYEKLKKAGFRDIEFALHRSGDVSDQFKVFSPDKNFMTNYSPVEFFAKQEYFELITRYANEYARAVELQPKPRLKDKRTAAVLLLFSDGASRRDIAKRKKLTVKVVSDILDEHLPLALASVTAKGSIDVEERETPDADRVLSRANERSPAASNCPRLEGPGKAAAVCKGCYCVRGASRN